ncbi:MAG: hypothetical protein M3007_07055, partial [Candidatus Eremiobacteraeota bacterium]|nr:hypothetical protein [Candidatus Eremiobacteraeota bacterium]
MHETDLEMGASLGNSSVWVNTKSSGAIERVFSLELGKCLINSILLRYGCTGSALGAEPDAKAHASSVMRYIGLNRDAPAQVEIHPAYQRRTFCLGGAISVTETVFVALTQQRHDTPIAYMQVDIHNTDSIAHDLRVMCFARLRGDFNKDVEARYEPSVRGLIAYNKSQPEAVRIFGLDAEPKAYSTTFDYGTVYDRSHVHPLSNDTTATGDILGALQLDISLRPNRSRKFCLKAGVYAGGQRAAIKAYKKAADCDSALVQTIDYIEHIVHRA